MQFSLLIFRPPLSFDRLFFEIYFCADESVVAVDDILRRHRTPSLRAA